MSVRIIRPSQRIRDSRLLGTFAQTPEQLAARNMKHNQQQAAKKRAVKEETLDMQWRLLMQRHGIA